LRQFCFVSSTFHGLLSQTIGFVESSLQLLLHSQRDIQSRRIDQFQQHVADYTVDVPTYRRDGDHRVYMLRLDGETGQLRVDDAFRDETTDEVGLDFNRVKWPHGATGAARPRGLLFVAAPPAE